MTIREAVRIGTSQLRKRVEKANNKECGVKSEDDPSLRGGASSRNNLVIQQASFAHKDCVPCGASGHNRNDEMPLDCVPCGAREHDRNDSIGCPLFATPALDAELLMAYTLHTTRDAVIARGNDEVDECKAKVFFRYIQQRQRGTPVAYITGIKEFYGLEYTVTPDVLIPKSDTELLVELSCRFLSTASCSLSPAPYPLSANIADICCGTGCVGISIAHECKELISSISFTDISPAALDVCKMNARRLLPEYDRALQDGKARQSISAEFLCGDLMSVFRGDRKFTLIVSNPPYVPSSVADALLKDGRGEPRIALDGDDDGPRVRRCRRRVSRGDGLAITKRLIKMAVPHMAHGGCLIIESSEEGVAKVATMMREAGLLDVTEHNDLSGRPRAAMGISSE